MESKTKSIRGGQVKADLNRNARFSKQLYSLEKVTN